ncbi:MAG: hypothetical protein FJ267_13000 [Planctomycetes bacterium]|nr:hypothetical protein [Planctomycetota bacterium]
MNPDCPTCVTCYECISRTQREQLATHYLEDWIRHWMSPYFEYPDVVSGGVNGDAFPSGSFDSGGMPQQYGAISAKMSNLINLWRVFTCANLRKLLNDEYPFTNLPFVLRNPPTFPDTCVDPSNQGLSAARPCPRPSPLTPAVLERDYQFVSQVYWPHQRPMFPNLFRNPLERDSQNYATAFAQASIFLPRAKFQCCPWGYEVPCSAEGGICCLIRYDNSPGSWNSFTLSNTDPSVIQTIIDDEHTFSFDARWERFGQWNSFNQNWTTKLVPATSSSIPSILSQHPSNYLNGYLQNYQVPRVAQMTPTQFQIVNGH